MVSTRYSGSRDRRCEEAVGMAGKKMEHGQGACCEQVAEA